MTLICQIIVPFSTNPYQAENELISLLRKLKRGYNSVTKKFPVGHISEYLVSLMVRYKHINAIISIVRCENFSSTFRTLGQRKFSTSTIYIIRVNADNLLTYRFNGHRSFKKEHSDNSMAAQEHSVQFMYCTNKLTR